MFLETLFVAALCGRMTIEAGQVVSLTSVNGRSCMEVSQVTYTGTARSQEWNGVNMSSSVFEGAVLADLWWHDSKISNVYLRANTRATKLVFERSRIHSLEILSSSLADIRVLSSEGGGWNLESATIGSLTFSPPYSFGRMAAKSLKAGNLHLDEGRIADFTVDKAIIDRFSMRKATVTGLAMQNVAVGNAEFTQSEIDGFAWLASGWSRGRIDGGATLNIFIENSEFNRLALNGVSWRAGRIASSRFTNLTADSVIWSGLKLTDVVLSYASFRGGVFGGVAAERVQLSNVTFENVRFENSDLRGFEIGEGTKFINCTFDASSKMPVPLPDGLTPNN